MQDLKPCTPTHLLQTNKNMVQTKNNLNGLPFHCECIPLSPFTTTKVLASLYNDVVQLIH